MSAGNHSVRDVARYACSLWCLLLLGFALTACFNLTENIPTGACGDTGDETEYDTGGTGCQDSIEVSEFPYVWKGSWSDYDNTFWADPLVCGDGMGVEDVWFRVSVPAASTLLIWESTESDVTIRHVLSCFEFDCYNYAENPELLSIYNQDASSWHIVVSEAGDNSVDEIEVGFDLVNEES